MVNPTNPLTSFPPSPPLTPSRLDSEKPADRGSAWVSLLVSVILHVNLLLILAATYRAFQEAPPPPLAIDTTFTPGAEDLAVTAPVLVLKEQATPLEQVLFNETAQPSASELAQTSDFEGAGRLGSPGGAAGIGGLGSGGGVGFFGTTARGRSFVFVVDCSGSMQQGRRFQRAVDELEKSVQQLEPDQKFQILFFNDAAVPLMHVEFHNQLLPATAAVRREVLSWIRRQRAQGGTVPDDALKQALALKPDVIFFLTDAESVPRVVRPLVNEHNKHGSTVHTIAFGHRGGEALMQGIAADHHGRYRFVP